MFEEDSCFNEKNNLAKLLFRQSISPKPLFSIFTPHSHLHSYNQHIQTLCFAGTAPERSAQGEAKHIRIKQQQHIRGFGSGPSV